MSSMTSRKWFARSVFPFRSSSSANLLSSPTVSPNAKRYGTLPTPRSSGSGTSSSWISERTIPTSAYSWNALSTYPALTKSGCSPRRLDSLDTSSLSSESFSSTFSPL